MGRGILSAELRRFEKIGKKIGENPEWKRRKNAENILKVKEIPCNNRITRLIDGINPGEFDENFRDGLGLAEQYGVLEQYQVLDGGVLIALDGV
jgi:hypothetical protein